MYLIAKLFLRQSVVLGVGLIAAGAHNALAADIGERVELHGYGFQSYMRSPDNTYLDADNDGTWVNNTLALVFTARLDDKSRLWAQLHNTSKITRLEWAFVDYQFTDRFTGRAGKLRLPLGLYNDIRDVRYLQMSALQPALYQDKAEIVSESFGGASALYSQPLADGSLQWEGYFGQVAPLEDEDHVKFKRLYGGRITWDTGVDGLRFILSANNSGVENSLTAIKGKTKLAVLSAEYASAPWDLKMEYANQKTFEDVSARTWYVQGGYTIAERWTPFLRYDYITTDRARRDDPSFYQKSTVVGLGYKVSDSIGLRVENHFNRGYALPVFSKEVAQGGGKDNWNLFSVSINFIF